jgi:hypothetical protein
VIENEFGEVGVDHQLVIGAEEEIFETNNGCICCTVRGDLLRILGQLLKRRDKFDYVLIETTGMADPGPVAQTFFLDDDLKRAVRARRHRHAGRRAALRAAPRERRSPSRWRSPMSSCSTRPTSWTPPRSLASSAACAHQRHGEDHRAQNADVPIDKVLGLGAFDLDRALAVDGNFLEPQYPFEWAGAYASLRRAGTSLRPVPRRMADTITRAHEHATTTMTMAAHMTTDTTIPRG